VKAENDESEEQGEEQREAVGYAEYEPADEQTERDELACGDLTLMMTDGHGTPEAEGGLASSIRAGSRGKFIRSRRAGPRWQGRAHQPDEAPHPDRRTGFFQPGWQVRRICFR